METLGVRPSPASDNLLMPGDIARWFVADCTSNPRYAFNTVAGRYVVMAFIGSAGSTQGAKHLAGALANASLYDDNHVLMFGVSIDPDDRERMTPRVPGVRHFWDNDRVISALYGALPSPQADAADYQSLTFVLDPALRVIARIPASDPSHDQVLAKFLHALPPVDHYAGTTLHAPVLVAPFVFERSFCQELIAEYERGQATDSGFMREENGRTVGKVDHGVKRRFDVLIESEQLRKGAMARISRRLLPMIRRAFDFDATRMERHIVACYEAAGGGYFRAHRDNTTKGTAHRRFAVTINLNAEEYDGGDLRFPEFGRRTYRAPTGGAVVFSCSLLHEATAVTSGRRFAYLPFLYDDRAAAQRAENNRFLADGVARYEIRESG